MTFNPKQPIILDTDPVPQNPSGFDGRGRTPRDYSAEPIGYGAGSKGKFPDSLRIPRTDWPGLIRERREKQAGMRNIRTKKNVGHLDQNGTNYCWANGPVQALKIVRAAANLEMVDLSPASVAAPIKKYRNQGGWGTQAFAYMVEHGVAPVELWPANYYKNANYDTEASRQARMNYKITEYYEIEPRDIEAVISSLLQDFVGAAGLNWWGHEVCYVDVALDDKGNVMVDADNSWKNYGDNGAFYLQGNKMIPDDYCCIRGVVAF